MKRKMVSILSCITCACLLMMTIVSASCQGNDSTQGESRYNLNPDLSEKVMASKNTPMEHVINRTLSGVLGASTCVIIGKVDFSIVTPTEVNPLICYAFTPYHTIASLKVLKTIAGTPPSDNTIQYGQIGSPEDPWQTQVKSGEVCVFILTYLEDMGWYKATALEESIFYVDENNKLTSMSDQPFAAKYDGIDLSILIDDIQELWETRMVSCVR